MIHLRQFLPTGLRTLALLLVLFSLAVEGHESRPAYLELVETTQDEYEVLWKVPSLGSDRALALDLRFSAEVQRISPTTSYVANGAYVERFTISRPGGLSDTEIYVEGLKHTLTDVLARIENLDGSTQTALLKPDKPFFVVATVADAPVISQIYLVLGIQHILEGIDHLLFVACLLIIAGIGKKLIWTITGFTLAHSITLALASLNLVRVPIPPTEATIALSIVFLATEIAKQDKTGLSYQYPVVVSVLFGLLHGFGFSSALKEIGLPQSNIPLALFSFNVGVEIGQLLFIVVLLVAWRLLTKTLAALPKLSLSSFVSTPLPEKAIAYTIGAVSSYWLIERVYGFWS